MKTNGGHEQSRVPFGGWQLTALLLAAIALVGILHFCARYLFVSGKASLAPSEFLTALALLLVCGLAFYVLRRIQTLSMVGWAFFAGSLMLVALQSCKAITALYYPENPPYAVDPLINGIQEGFFAIGLGLILASFFFCLLVADRMSTDLRREQRELLREAEERKRAQRALQESEETLRAIVATTPESLLLLGLDGTIVTLNETAAARLGKTIEEARGHNITEFVREQAVIRRRHARIEEAARTKRMIRFEDARENRCYDNCIHPVLNPEGEVARVAVMAIDITDRIRAEEQLRGLNAQLEQIVGERTAALTEANTRLQEEIEERKEAQQRLAEAADLNRRLIEASSLGIEVYKASGSRVFANDALLRMIGATREEAATQNYLELESWRRSGLLEVAQSALADGRPRAGEIHVLTTFGRDVWLLYHISPFISVGEQHLLLIMEDVTERVLREQTIAEQRMKMMHTARMSALGIMAGGIAHEVRNPLAIISTAIQQLDTMLEKRGQTEGQLLRLMGIIDRNVKRIDGIVQAMHGLSRESAGDPFRVVAIDKVVHDVLELSLHRFREAGIELDSTRNRNVEIECRPAQLAQVILNLLNNAHDAVAALPEKWVRLAVDETDAGVDISVTDSGGGLPDNIRSEIFVPFFTTKEEGRGTGLGLSISRSIVESHHGELLVDTDCPNTRFVVRIPKRQP